MNGIDKVVALKDLLQKNIEALKDTSIYNSRIGQVFVAIFRFKT